MTALSSAYELKKARPFLPLAPAGGAAGVHELVRRTPYSGVPARLRSGGRRGWEGFEEAAGAHAVLPVQAEADEACRVFRPVGHGPQASCHNAPARSTG